MFLHISEMSEKENAIFNLFLGAYAVGMSKSEVGGNLCYNQALQPILGNYYKSSYCLFMLYYYKIELPYTYTQQNIEGVF